MLDLKPVSEGSEDKKGAVQEQANLDKEQNS